MARKIYVEVFARFDVEGNLTPISIVWEDGRTFEIDRVLETRRAASTKAGSVGLVYRGEGLIYRLEWSTLSPRM